MTSVSTLVRLLLASRLLCALLCIVANLLLGDHDADAFRWLPVAKHHPTTAPNFIDGAVRRSLAAFTRWDAAHFLHIAERSYTFENNLAFAPLFPGLLAVLSQNMLVRFAGGLLWLSSSAVLLLLGFLLNLLCFVVAGVMLYRLSMRVCDGDALLSLTATVLFAFNPASVFFTTNYSEAIFSALTFSGLNALYRPSSSANLLPLTSRCVEASVWFGLATLARTNGLMNLGFIGFVLLCNMITVPWSTYWKLVGMSLRHACIFFLCILIVFVPYYLHWYNMHQTFCSPSPEPLPADLVKLARDRHYISVGDSQLSWCRWSLLELPSIYGYLQQKYWQVGFLRYWTWRKSPLFLLAAPTLILAFSGAVVYVRELPLSLRSMLHRVCHERNLLPFVVHVLFLACTALFFINVEVVTRLLFSSTPVMYWFCAWLLLGTFSDANYLEQNLRNRSAFCIIGTLWSLSGTSGQAILLYYLLYFVVGCVLHCNFYPWT